jgi:hypothetical protein
VEIAAANSYILSNAGRKERGQKLQTQLAYCKNFIIQSVDSVRNRNSWKEEDIDRRQNGKINFIMQKENQSTRLHGL